MYVGLFIDFKIMIPSLQKSDGTFSIFLSTLATKSTYCQTLSYPKNSPTPSTRDTVISLLYDDFFPIALSTTKNVISGIIIVIPENTLNIFKNPDGTLIPTYILNGDIFNLSIGHCIIRSKIESNSVFKCGIYDICTHVGYKVTTPIPPTSSDFFESILLTLLLLFPDDTILWLGVDPQNDKFLQACGLYTKYGFKNPYMSFTDCFGTNFSSKFPYGFLSLTRVNDYDGFEVGKERDNIILEIIYILQQQILLTKNPLFPCSLILRFNPKNAFYLKQLVLYSSTYNKSASTITQKEIGGAFNLKPIQINPPPPSKAAITTDVIWEISSTTGKKEYGTESNVNILPVRYNYHTHPKGTYSLFNVQVGIPSGDDFLAFLYSSYKYDTIFHSVISVEGIYVISLKQFWTITKNYNILMNDFVKNLVDPKFPTNTLKLFWQKEHKNYINNISSYCNFINIETIPITLSSLFTNNIDLITSLSTEPLFQCNYISYFDIQNLKYFEISFHRKGNPEQCFITDSMYENYSINQTFK
jgi:hypothetical protein